MQQVGGKFGGSEPVSKKRFVHPALFPENLAIRRVYRPLPGGGFPLVGRE